MAVNELERLTAKVQMTGKAHPLEEGMTQPSALPANEIAEIGIVISEDINGLHPRQPIEKPDALCEHLADVALPQLKQVPADDKPTMIVLHEIEKRSKLVFSVAVGPVRIFVSEASGMLFAKFKFRTF